MIYLICSIYDVKVDAYAAPFIMRTRAEAIRAFTEHVNDPKSAANKYPDDYILYSLGTFDDAEGLINSNPERIALASDYKAPPKNDQLEPIDVTDAINRKRKERTA